MNLTHFRESQSKAIVITSNVPILFIFWLLLRYSIFDINRPIKLFLVLNIIWLDHM